MNLVQLTGFQWTFSCESKVGSGYWYNTDDTCNYFHNVWVPRISVSFYMCRLVHAFTSAGILPSQYVQFSLFASIGMVGKWYLQQGVGTVF